MLMRDIPSGTRRVVRRDNGVGLGGAGWSAWNDGDDGRIDSVAGWSASDSRLGWGVGVGGFGGLMPGFYRESARESSIPAP